VSTQQNEPNTKSELHIPNPKALSKEEFSLFKKINVVGYDNSIAEYPIDVCMKRITAQYGSKFATVCKIMLDYN
jgi:hypothetical protein